MKTDRKLGEEVNKMLLELGIETPTHKTDFTFAERQKHIETSFEVIMRMLNLDLTDDSLADTPRRIANMFLLEIFEGLNYYNFPKCTRVENKMKYDEMVTIKDISVMSTCEHHFVTIDGLAKVSYIPKDYVIGLSKINRIVRFFSKRPQIQERLTEQIYHTLCYILKTEDVAVKIDAVHYCVKSRGIEDSSSSTTTTRLGGEFLKPEVRSEFLTY